MFINRAKQETATTGTGPITLGTAPSGFQTFADAGAVDGTALPYVIEDQGAWEIGLATPSASATVLARTVIETSNPGNAALNLSGNAVVYSGPSAVDFAPINDAAASAWQTWSSEKIASAIAARQLSATSVSHVSGVIDVDVAAADVFDFVADDYTAPSSLSVVGAVGGSAVPDNEQPHASTLPGDIVLFGYYCQDDTSYHFGAGWTALVGEFGYNNATQTFRVMYQVVSDPVSVSIDASGTGAFAWSMVTLRGQDAASPLDTAHVFAESVGSLDLAAITTVTSDALAVLMFGNKNYGNAAYAPPAGYAQLSHFAGGTSFSFPGFSVLTKALPGAGVENPAAIDAPGNYTMGALLALRGQVGAGEKDYTLNITNKPATGVRPILVYLEVKTTAGSWDVSDIDEWIGGAPDLNVVGVHAIEVHANAAKTKAEHKGLVA